MTFLQRCGGPVEIGEDLPEFVVARVGDAVVVAPVGELVERIAQHPDRAGQALREQVGAARDGGAGDERQDREQDEHQIGDLVQRRLVEPEMDLTDFPVDWNRIGALKSSTPRRSARR